MEQGEFLRQSSIDLSRAEADKSVTRNIVEAIAMNLSGQRIATHHSNATYQIATYHLKVKLPITGICVVIGGGICARGSRECSRELITLMRIEVK
jgi:uridylate kinase